LSQEALAVVYRTQRERDMFEEISALRERERERDGFANKLAKKKEKENLGVVLLEFVEEEVESDADISV
jgi:hypothetical protein